MFVDEVKFLRVIKYRYSLIGVGGRVSSGFRVGVWIIFLRGCSFFVYRLLCWVWDTFFCG